MLKQLRARLICAFTGHPTRRTGRSLNITHQERCDRCGRLFVSCDDYPRALLPWNDDTEQFFLHREQRR